MIDRPLPRFVLLLWLLCTFSPAGASTDATASIHGAPLMAPTLLAPTDSAQETGGQDQSGLGGAVFDPFGRVGQRHESAGSAGVPEKGGDATLTLIGMALAGWALWYLLRNGAGD